MALICGRFLALVTRPFPFEFGGGHLRFVILKPTAKKSRQVPE
jgi:hypothetical protein